MTENVTFSETIGCFVSRGRDRERDNARMRRTILNRSLLDIEGSKTYMCRRSTSYRSVPSGIRWRRQTTYRSPTAPVVFTSKTRYAVTAITGTGTAKSGVATTVILTSGASPIGNSCSRRWNCPNAAA